MAHREGIREFMNGIVLQGLVVDWGCGTKPIKTSWMQGQSGHEPSMKYAQNIYKVASKLNDFSALEIGGAWGFSTLALLEAGAKDLITVDPNTQAQAKNEADANGYTNHAWLPIRSHEYWNTNKDTFDLIYVDGSHIYADVYNDLYQAWERLNTGGILLIDDWDHKKNVEVKNGELEYGVSLACFEFWRDHKVKSVGIEGRVLWFKK